MVQDPPAGSTTPALHASDRTTKSAGWSPATDTPARVRFPVVLFDTVTGFGALGICRCWPAKSSAAGWSSKEVAPGSWGVAVRCGDTPGVGDVSGGDVVPGVRYVCGGDVGPGLETVGPVA